MSRSGSLVLVAHKFVSCSTLLLLQAIHLPDQNVLLLCDVFHHHHVVEVFPASEGSFSVMLVNPRNQGLEEPLGRAILIRKRFDCVIDAFLLLELKSDFHFIKSVFVPSVLLSKAHSKSVPVPGHTEVSTTHFLENSLSTVRLGVALRVSLSPPV